MTVELLVDTALDCAYFRKRWMGKCHCGINGTTTDRARPTKRRSGTKVCARSLSLARHTPLGEFHHTLQVMANSYDRRDRMLHEGADFPKERREIGIWVDEEIEREKNNLFIFTIKLI